MKRYRIRTLAGGGVGWMTLGGSITTFEIEDSSTGARAFYTFSSVDFGFGVGGQGTSSWSDFHSNAGLLDFHGYATATAALLAIGAGFGVGTMHLITGPAAPVTIPLKGWLTGVGAAVGGSHGWLKLRV